MRWRGRKQSDNIEDRRGMGGGAAVAGGGGIMTLIVIVVVMLMGGNPQPLIQNAARQRAQQQQQAPAPENEKDKELKQFVGVVLKDTEDVWTKLFKDQLGTTYRKPDLVLFTGSVNSGCGTANSGMGPFYCPADNKIYLDMSFFTELRDRFGAPGDFAMAYVVAHEAAHHVQNELHISDEVHRKKQATRDKVEQNHWSVRLELQADFLSGVWAHHGQKMKNFLEAGDVEEAMRCAQAIGDDMIQKQAQGRVVPDLFTHGTSAQRARWFRAGLESGNLELANKLFELPYDKL